MSKIRILVVEDSLTVRKYLVEVLQSCADLEVIAEAKDGKEAIELCEVLRPDIVTMDMMLPVMTGMAATEYIMAYCPTPILIVSASTNRGELFKTYQALAAGAIDVIEKPLGDNRDEDWEKTFISTVKLVSKIKAITHPRAKLRLESRSTPSSVVYHAQREIPQNVEYRLVVIGVSTGGPQALAELLGHLPTTFPLPILIVIHISTAFGVAFADWLNDQSSIPVSTAVHGSLLPAVGHPQVLLAPPDQHLTVSGNRIWLNSGPEVHSCRPSVDVLFESVAQEMGDRAIALLLTGMGRDGARGLLAIHLAGGLTIAQDEASCVVFGMPREAISMEAARRILPLQEMVPLLSSLAAKRVGKPL